MKFGVVGFIAFFIDYGLLAFCTEILHFHYLVSATIGFTVSVVFNYLASMRYVFTHKEGMSKRREFIIFVVLSIIGLIINNALMWLGCDVLGIHYLIVKIFATAVVMVWNFVTRKIFLDAGDEAKQVEGAAESEASAETASGPKTNANAGAESEASAGAATGPKASESAGVNSDTGAVAGPRANANTKTDQKAERRS